MGFADLRRRQICDEHSDEFNLDADYDLPAPVLYPSDTGYVCTVYLNPAVLSAKKVDEIKVEYEARYPGRTFDFEYVKAESLKWRRIGNSVRAEQTFKIRGYVSILEDRQVPAGHRPDTKFAKAQKKIVWVQSFMMGKMLHFAVAPVPGLGIPRNPMAPLTGRDSKLTQREVEAALPDWQLEFEGQDDEPDWEHFRRNKAVPDDYALVEYRGLLLGRKQVSHDDRIHMAYSGTPGSFDRGGRLAMNSGSWSTWGSAEAERRLKLELAPATIDDVFGYGHWPLLAANPVVDVSYAMIVAWQSQALASLRKIVWRLCADELPSAINNELYADRHAPSLRGAIPRKPLGTGRLAKREPFGHKLDAVLADDVSYYIESLERNGRQAGTQNALLRLSHRDLVIGAFYGLAHDLDDPGFARPAIYEIADWLGRLRRRGRAIVDRWFWESVTYFVANDPLSDFVFSMLSEQAWEVLLNAARVLDPGETFEVSYRFSTLEQPWSAILQEDTIAITGPMLFFPVSEAAFWHEKAELIRENGGFVAPAIEIPPGA